MANPEHVAKLKEGMEAWNAWRKTSNETPDLSGVELNGDSLDSYDLSSANFSRTRLDLLSFHRAAIDGASFQRAELSEVTFRFSDLRNCDFRNALIVYGSFHRSTLDA